MRRLWLIDAGYMIKAQRSVGDTYTFDYGKLKAKLAEDGDIWRTYYLNSVPDGPTGAQDGFHNWLRSSIGGGPGIITKLYGLKENTVRSLYCATCGRKVDVACPNGANHPLSVVHQKGVDVGLATLSLKHIDNYDTLILSSGDGDLLDAIEYITERGKRFELAVFDYGVSVDLQSRADKVYLINDFSKEVGR